MTPLTSRQWVAKGMELVTFLFAAFNNFLLDIAPPPEAGNRFAVGFVSMLTLIVLLLIWALLRQWSPSQLKRVFLIGALCLLVVFVASGFIYRSDYDKLTYYYPPDFPTGVGLAGTKFTSEAQAYLKEPANHLKTKAELVAEFGGTAERVWSRDSINSAGQLLTVEYVLFVVSCASLVFALTEVLL